MNQSNQHSPLIKQCQDIAQKAHTGQVDKAGEDYLLHPILVSLMVQAH